MDRCHQRHEAATRHGGDAHGPHLPRLGRDRDHEITGVRPRRKLPVRAREQASARLLPRSQELGHRPDDASFPQTSPRCGGGPGTAVYDDVAFEVTLRAPTNTTGVAFDFSFYTFEYPDFICSEVNDQFLAWMQPPPAGVPNGNISFDAEGNPISVNAAFFGVCNGCPLGAAELLGTGFDDWTCFADDGEAGATGWLTTEAPVTGGQDFTIRFAIFDAGDEILDSSAIIDNVRWIPNGGNVEVVTTPD